MDLIDKYKKYIKCKHIIDPVFGFELELLYNRYKVCDIEKATYHSPSYKTFGRMFYAENDSSISSSSDKYESVELISKPFKLRSFDRVFNDLIDTFKAYTIENKDNIDLSDILLINSTCGCHIHVTPLLTISRSKQKIWHTISYKSKRTTFYGKPLPIREIITPNFIKSLRHRTFGYIKTYVPCMFESFKTNYFRTHAKDWKNIEELKSSRYVEFNLTVKPERFEYRSFNVCGVKDFKSLYRMLLCGLLSIHKTLNEEFAKKNPFYSELNNKILNDNVHYVMYRPLPYTIRKVLVTTKLSKLPYVNIKDCDYNVELSSIV